MSNSKLNRIIPSIIILFIANFLFFNCSTASSLDPKDQNKSSSDVVKFEVKNFDQQIFFIFYHSDDTNAKFNISNKTDVVVSFNKQILFLYTFQFFSRQTKSIVFVGFLFFLFFLWSGPGVLAQDGWPDGTV